MSGDGIYVASKTIHAAKWRALRAAGAPIISTWIDEAGAGESASMRDLWRRCVDEAAKADALVLYHELGDVLKGAFVEVGAALAFNTPILVVGDPPGSWVEHHLVQRLATLDDAMALATALVNGVGHRLCPECGRLRRLTTTRMPLRDTPLYCWRDYPSTPLRAELCPQATADADCAQAVAALAAERHP